MATSPAGHRKQRHSPPLGKWALVISLAVIVITAAAWMSRATEPVRQRSPLRGRTTDVAAHLQHQELRVANQDTESVPPFRPQPQNERPMAPQNVPANPPNEALPPPARAADENPGFFGQDQVRLRSLGGTQPAGVTPKPSKETLERYSELVERTIDPENTLDLVVGRPRLLVLKQLPTRVQIADENVASYLLISQKEISVVGNRVGSTILNVWFGQPDAPDSRILSYLVRVVPDPEEKERLDRVYDALADEINRTFPDSVVKLSLVGDRVVVSGQAKDVIEAAQILRVVAANAPGGGTQDTTNEIPIGSVNLNLAPGLDPSGALTEQGLHNFVLRDIGRNIINLLRVPGEQQVMLRVTVAEVNRTAARSIGIDWSAAVNGNNFVFASLTGGLIPTTVSGSGTSTQTVGGNLPVSIDNGQVRLAIEALRNLNLARSLAEPNLTALNGQQAQFRAGGEFPVPVGTSSFGGTAQGVDFVPFGVQLSFTPFITDRDRVRLQINAAVSTRDASLGTNINGAAIAGGTSVTGLNSRTFSTTVELREGQTMAVAGLIQNNFGATTARVPYFGDLPIIGNFFGKNQSSAAEQELVILITPEFVAPLAACETPPLPGADVFEPSDLEFYLMGRLESRRSQDFRSAARTDRDRQISYQDCEDTFIVGAKGRSINCCPTGRDCNTPAAHAEDLPTIDATSQPPSHSANERGSMASRPAVGNSPVLIAR